MPRFPLYPRLCRAAAVSLAVSGIVASGAPAAVASPLIAPTPAPVSLHVVAAPQAPTVAAPAASAVPVSSFSPATTAAPIAPSIPSQNPAPSSPTPPTPSPTQNGLLWNGDLSTSSFSQYPFLWACPGGVTLAPLVPYRGAPSAKFTVTDTSNSAFCPGHVFTHNPASSLLTPGLFGNGDDRYISFATLFPTGFPTITNWFQVAEIYGPPYGGSPTVSIDVKGNKIGLWRDGTHNFDTPWMAPLQINQWMNVTLHVKFSTNPSVGFVEIWLNGVQQHFNNGSTRLYYTTLLAGDNWNGSTKNDLDLDQYRALTPSLGSVSIYHAAAKVGMTLASVAGGS